MKHNYTFNFLIKFLYKETSLLRTFEIENQIDEDVAVKREFKRLKSAYNLLPKISFYPSDKTLSTILDYSQKTSLNPSF